MLMPEQTEYAVCLDITSSKTKLCVKMSTVTAAAFFYTDVYSL